MIKNERQYRITKSQADKFAKALAGYRRDLSLDSDLHPILRKAQEDALESQLSDLESQLHEYDSLKAGNFSFDELKSISDLPKTMVRARIARGWSQRDLADALNLKEQQIQRYEATDYASASLSRIGEVIGALGGRLDEELLPSDERRTLDDVLRDLAGLGLPKEFIMRRLVPREYADHDDRSLPHPAAAYTYIGRVFGWGVRDLLGGAPLQLQTIANVRFKVAAHVNEQRASAYAVYAHYLALLAGQASPQLLQKSIPQDPIQLRSEIIKTYGSLSLDATVRFIWDLGIPVLALDDPGAFHGACFREGGRNLIVLKQKSSSESRWTHDAIHELWHGSQARDEADRTVLEPDEMSEDRRRSHEERTANQFAGAVLLAGRGHELASKSLARANNDLVQLKTAVQRIALQESVPVDALANYLAFRLADEQKANWWGAASNLQPTGRPWNAVRAVFFERADFSHLAEPDRQILAQALVPWEEAAG